MCRARTTDFPDCWLTTPDFTAWHWPLSVISPGPAASPCRYEYRRYLFPSPYSHIHHHSAYILISSLPRFLRFFVSRNPGCLSLRDAYVFGRVIRRITAPPRCIENTSFVIYDIGYILCVFPFCFSCYSLVDDGALQNAWRPLTCVRGIDHAALEHGGIGKYKSNHLRQSLRAFGVLTLETVIYF